MRRKSKTPAFTVLRGDLTLKTGVTLHERAYSQARDLDRAAVEELLPDNEKYPQNDATEEITTRD